MYKIRSPKFGKRETMQPLHQKLTKFEHKYALISGRGSYETNFFAKKPYFFYNFHLKSFLISRQIKDLYSCHTLLHVKAY